MNRLAHEKSPYLLQHAANPVDWHPWGQEAFAKAQREDKPIFLSIGYSTCYWCHVMEAESFENPAIAKLMNDTVVAVKVDREERPDLDAVYMSAVQAMSGQGGWPMSVFLTPEGKPFWGGTYFPPEDRWGRPGFPAILSKISQAWKSQRQQVLESSEAITQAIQAPAPATEGSPESEARGTLTAEALSRAVSQCAQQFDERFGGFGDAPKFPRPHTLSFLLRAWSRDQDAKTRRMVEVTLQRMADGGIHDQIGGGFHRYSTDAHWLVPHFEKMLYDQALIARVYLETYQATGKDAYADVARDIFEYVLRDLRDPEGGFYAAEDAGEVGEEGACYVWTLRDIEQALTPEEAAVVKRVYGVTPEGNFAESGKPGATILSVMALEAAPGLQAARQALLRVRSQRRRPHRDDKILTDWNGLMIGALALGGRVLQEPRYTQAARQAADFVLAHLARDGQLLHRYRDGQADIPAFLDDYAFLAWGLTDLYEAAFEAADLAKAKELARQMIEFFWDREGGGFFLSGSRNEPLIATRKELYDGALPSGNSVAALALLRVAGLTQDRELEALAERMMQTFANEAGQLPSAFPQFMIAADWWLGPSQEIVIAGDPDAADTRRLLDVVRQRFLPRAALILHPPGGQGEDIERLAPFVKTQQPLEGRATAYVCERGACQLPVTDPQQLSALLDRQQPGR